MRSLLLYSNIVATAILFGCSNSTDEGDYIEWATPVVSQEVKSKTSSLVSFTARASWGSSCGGFSRAVVAKTDSVYSIKVFGRQPKNAVCLAVMISFEAPVTINIPSPGTYSFKFWRSDSTTIDTTFIVQ